jgi:hypothetical protein
MKPFFTCAIFLVFLASCSHKITRIGYSDSNPRYGECEISIVRQLNLPDSLRKVGEIKLGESGFSTSCSEAHAIQILKKEGCALEAHVIHITEERRPDFWSTCYRCSADFYQYAGEVTITQSDPAYTTLELDKRVSRDRKTNSSNIVLGILGGIAGGIIAALILY